MNSNGEFISDGQNAGNPGKMPYIFYYMLGCVCVCVYVCVYVPLRLCPPAVPFGHSLRWYMFFGYVQYTGRLSLQKGARNLTSLFNVHLQVSHCSTGFDQPHLRCLLESACCGALWLCGCLVAKREEVVRRFRYRTSWCVRVRNSPREKKKTYEKRGCGKQYYMLWIRQVIWKT